MIRIAMHIPLYSLASGLTLARSTRFATSIRLWSVRAMATSLAYVPGSVHEDGSVVPNTPLSDKRKYRVITLPNRMRVALIHDPAADKGAACVTTAIGSLSDPWELPGLSHFLEHLLFLGTDKFPDEGTYKKFLKDHGGGSNASTSSEATTYHFFVHKDHLVGEGKALDRFASFFTGPLMTPSATERELGAVDSENSRNLNDDGRREWQVRKHVSAPGHVFRKFGTGNRITLSPPSVDVRGALLAHYHKYYSSNIQAAAVLGVQSLDELEAAVRAGLEGVVDKGVSIPVAEEQGTQYQFGQTGRIVYLTPVRDLRHLDITFPMPNPPTPDMEHTSRLLSHTLGYEGQGSLLSALKARGWVNGLSAGGTSFRQCSTFNVDISLTQEGLQHVHEVVRMVLEYVNVLRGASPEEWTRIHAEVRQTADNSVRFRPTTEPVSAVTSLATALVDYDPMHILTGRSLLPESPNLTRLRDMLACVTPNNMLLFVTAQGYGPASSGNEDGAVTLKEPYYGFTYGVAPFSPSQRELWGMPAVDTLPRDPSSPPAPMDEWSVLPSGARFPGKVDLTLPQLDAARSADYATGLAMPPVNPFIPADFDLKPLERGTVCITPSEPERVALNGGSPGGVDSRVAGASGAAAQPAALPGAAPTALSTETGVGVAALRSVQPSVPVTVDIVVAEQASPSAQAAAGMVAEEGGNPNPVPSVEDKLPIPSFPLLLEPVSWDVPLPEGAAPSLHSLPMRSSFAQSVLKFPSVFPQPKTLQTQGTALGEEVRAWYYQDGVFRLPKTYVTARLVMSADKRRDGDPFKRSCAALASSLVNDLLTECTYDAACAGLGYDFHTSSESGYVYFGASGYSHTLPVLFRTVLTKVASIPAEGDGVLKPVFDRLKDAYLRQLANFSKAHPQTRAADLINQYLVHPYTSKEDTLAAAKGVQLEHVKEYLMGLAAVSPATAMPVRQEAAGVLPYVPLEVLVSGNTDAQDALSYAQTLKSLIPPSAATASGAASIADAGVPSTGTAAQAKGEQGTPREQNGVPQFEQPRAVFLRPGTTLVLTRQHPNPAEPNAAVEVIWQLGPATTRMRALVALLAQAWAQPAFDTLRTKEQLGYSVSSGSTSLGDGGTLCVHITVQGQVSSVDHLQARVDAFVDGFRTQLEEITEEEFAKRAAIIAHKLTEPTKTQSEAHSRLRGPLESRRVQWNGSEAVAAAVKAATLGDLKHVYDSAIMSNGKLLRKVVSRIYAQPQTKPATPSASEGPEQSGPGTDSKSILKGQEAPIHDGGPSKVPEQHPCEAPASPADFHRNMLLPATFITPDEQLVPSIPASLSAGASAAASHGGATTGVSLDTAKGVWMPLLTEIPQSIRTE